MMTAIEVQMLHVVFFPKKGQNFCQYLFLKNEDPVHTNKIKIFYSDSVVVAYHRDLSYPK